MLTLIGIRHSWLYYKRDASVFFWNWLELNEPIQQKNSISAICHPHLNVIDDNTLGSLTAIHIAYLFFQTDNVYLRMVGGFWPSGYPVERSQKICIPWKSGFQDSNLVWIIFFCATHWCCLTYHGLVWIYSVYCDVPGSPCLSKMGPIVGPYFSIVGSVSLG